MTAVGAVCPVWFDPCTCCCYCCCTPLCPATFGAPSPRIRFPQILNGQLALPHAVFTVPFDDSAWAVAEVVASPPWPATPADIETAPGTHVPGAHVGPYSVLAAGQLTLGTALVCWGAPPKLRASEGLEPLHRRSPCHPPPTPPTPNTHTPHTLFVPRSARPAFCAHTHTPLHPQRTANLGTPCLSLPPPTPNPHLHPHPPSLPPQTNSDSYNMAEVTLTSNFTVDPAVQSAFASWVAADQAPVVTVYAKGNTVRTAGLPACGVLSLFTVNLTWLPL